MRNLTLSNGIYKLLYNQNLYLRGYAKIYSNKGSLTPGVDDNDTLDGMSLKKINNIIEAVRQEKYWWTPVRRVYIPKANGKRRALGIPSGSDKLLQEVLRSILEAYFEPQFSDFSHGFRPVRSPSTALVKVQKVWTGTRWWVEGDIEQYFDTIDHEILMEILGRKIKDQRFLTLIRRYLAAGYMEDDWQLVKNLSGVPQGGVLSPLLSNIYLNELDVFAENVLIPKYNLGKERKANPEYRRVCSRLERARKSGKHQRVKELIAEQRQLPSKDPLDPNYRRLRYIRYADDFLIGFAGPKREAMQIKEELTQFLRDHLNLKLNEEKTLITHAGSKPARFLGYDIQTQYANDQIDQNTGRRSINGKIGLRVPKSTIDNYVNQFRKNGKPAHISMLISRGALLHRELVSAKAGRYRGILYIGLECSSPMASRQRNARIPA